MDKAIFVIKIIETQHGTWQGSLTQAIDNKMVYFRSALELLKIMDDEIARLSGVEEENRDLAQ